MAIAAALFLIVAYAAATPERGIRIHGQNSVADALEQRALVLGIDFERGPAKPPGTTSLDLHAFSSAGFGAWLNAEIERPDDVITKPPAALRDYLEEHHDAIWAIVAVLEKGSPDWGEREGDDLWPTQVLLPTVMIERALLAVALCEERNGDPIAASRALEASWSLSRPAGSRGFLIDRLVSAGIEKLQAGVLRKLKEPSVPWMGRLSGDQSWTGMLNALDRETGPGSGMATDDFTKALRRLHRAVADRYRKLSACDASRQTDDEVWRAVASEIETDPNPGIRASAEPPPPTGPDSQPGAEPEAPAEEQRLYFKDLLPTVTSALRRAARLAVDRELTLRILELRLDKAASRENKWPSKLVNPTSGGCPEASYAYTNEGDGMEIRFEGDIASPEVAPTLPLTFHTGKSKGPVTPSPPPTPIPTPVSDEP